MRRIAFLDFDGVLNSEQWLVDGERPEVTVNGETRTVGLDPNAVELLNYITGLDVEWVLSSTWRGDGTGHLTMTEVLRQLGWHGGLIDSTPVLTSPASSIHVDYSRAAQPNRGDEILAWLERDGVSLQDLGPDCRIAIFDDDTDLGPLADYRVEIDRSVGLTPTNVLQAALLLDRALVMVDELVKPKVPRSVALKRGCAHLTVSGTGPHHLEALHEFAIRHTRMWREWFEVAPMHGATDLGHYYVTRGNHARALRLGALFVPGIEQARARRWARDRGIG